MKKTKTFTTEFVHKYMGFENNGHNRFLDNRQPSLKDPPLQRLKERFYTAVSHILEEDIPYDVLAVYDEDFIKNKRKEERFRKTALFFTSMMMSILFWKMLSEAFIRLPF